MSGADDSARWVEAQLAIRELAARYVIALDGRDARSWAALYVPDVVVGSPVDSTGRDALEQWFRAKCAYWYRSMHLIGAHQIDFLDEDHATGLVQCRVEQEMGRRFVTTAFLYRDSYERRGGDWFFAHRGGMPMWSFDQHEDPVETFARPALPGGMPIRLPRQYPEFVEFWTDFTDEEIGEITSVPVGRGEPNPKDGAS